MVMSFWLSYTMRSITPISVALIGRLYARHMDLRRECNIRPEDYDDDDNIDIWVDVDMPPVLPRCEFAKLIC